MQPCLAAIDNSGEESCRLAFGLEQWCFWQSEALPTENAWPRGQVLPCGPNGVDIQFLPMMQRRRLSPLAKAACAVAWCCREAYGNMPTVFYSAHGESQYYFDLLCDMAQGEAVSPSRFSLCVHNAIAGLFSFQTENVLPYVSLAGGGEGILAAFIEAAGLLLKMPRVMLVCYEQPLPPHYRSRQQAIDKTWALAMVLGRAEPDALQLQWIRRTGTNGKQGLTNESAFPDAVVGGQSSGCLRFPQSVWCWQLLHV